MSSGSILNCAIDETKLWLSKFVNYRINPCSGPPPLYQDLSTPHDWPVEKAFVDLSIRMKRNLKSISGNLLSPLGAKNKEQGYHRCCADITNQG